ncbi:MAG: hypothetical protein PWP23_507 [Candidatus Sumerlaeota bacterium]|nr:hypothetical protein [Candidatus Sumerlaeota bacterium]
MTTGMTIRFWLRAGAVLLSCAPFVVGAQALDPLAGSEMVHAAPEPADPAPVDGAVAPEAPAPTPAPVESPSAPWYARVQEFQQYQTHNEGLNHLVTALQGMDAVGTQSLNALNPALENILRNGWVAPHSEVVSALQTLAAPIESAIACGEAPAFLLPPMRGFDDPAPNVYSIVALNKLMLVQAEGHLAAGRADEAARIARAALGYSWYLRADDYPILYHAVSLSNTQRCFPTLQRIVKSPLLSDDARKAIGSDLFKLDTQWPPLSRAVAREGSMSMDYARRMLNDEKEREKVLASLAHLPKQKVLFLESLRRFGSDEAAVRRLWSGWFQFATKPAWERAPSDAESLMELAAELKMLEPLPDFREVAFRDDLCRTSLRLTMALVAVRSNKQEAAKTFLDPFDGQPLRVTADRVYSVGPDGVDDRGGKRFELEKGVNSPGDITVMLR